eukprot:scaffold42851_cov69-Phaeocystis_antarctica.AAC.2
MCTGRVAFSVRTTEAQHIYEPRANMPLRGSTTAVFLPCRLVFYLLAAALASAITAAFALSSATWLGSARRAARRRA